MDRTTRETRRQSYDAVLPKREKRCRLILETLGDREMTASEITEELVAAGEIPYFNRNYVAPRLAEMKQMGILKTVGRRKATRSDATEEIADVQIMLDQLRLIFARSTDEVEEDKLRRLLGRLNSYAESNLHDWLNKQPEPGIWCRTVGAGVQPREGGAPNE